MSAASENDSARVGRGETRRHPPSLISPRRVSKLDFEPQFSPAGPTAPLDLTAYGRSLIRRKWAVLVTLLIAMALGIGVTLLTRPIYTAQTTLQIDREAEKVVSRDEATPQDNLGEEFFQTQYGLLRSRALAERVAQTQGLLVNDDFIAKMKDQPLRSAAKSAIAGHGRTTTTIKLLQSRRSENVEARSPKR